jgi:hypothetical protein
MANLSDLVGPSPCWLFVGGPKDGEVVALPGPLYQQVVIPIRPSYYASYNDANYQGFREVVYVPWMELQVSAYLALEARIPPALLADPITRSHDAYPLRCLVLDSLLTPPEEGYEDLYEEFDLQGMATAHLLRIADPA